MRLVLPALAADKAVDVRGIGAMLEVVSRVAVRAASSFSDQSWSVLVSPHTWLEVRPGHGARPGRAGLRKSRPGAVAASRQVAASALGLVRGPSKRRFELHGIGRSHQPASGSGCRVPPVGRVVGLRIG